MTSTKLPLWQGSSPLIPYQINEELGLFGRDHDLYTARYLIDDELDLLGRDHDFYTATR